MKYRLAVLTSHVIQYQDPLFKQLADHPEIDLTVLFCSRMGAEPYLDSDLGVELSWDLEMLNGYHHKFLRNLSRSSDAGFWARVNPGIGPAIARGKYDAVLIMGWGSATTWLAFIACYSLRTPFFLNGDTSFVEDPPTLKGRLRKALLRQLFRRTSAFMLMGTMNGDFYRYFGADSRRFFLMPYAIDNERFRRGSQMSPTTRAGMLRDLGVEPGRVVILFCGKLIQRKNPIHVVKAVESMQRRDRVAVLFMGDGIERKSLEAYVKQRNIAHVHFLGFVNQAEMPRVYGVSDIFVLPSSQDHRGTVVNEAMACGLPVVITDQVGIWGDGDIVRDGDNGFVLPVGDIAQFATVLDSLVADSELRARMGKRSLEIIAEWNYERDVEGILAALSSTTRHASTRELAPSHEAH